MKAFSLRTEPKLLISYRSLSLSQKVTLCVVGLCVEVSYINKSSHAITCKAWVTSHMDSSLMKLLNRCGKHMQSVIKYECATLRKY